ncbi:hypothetical protein Deba_0426 [Desulfarculus baarsii DSM 2075]|uniref:Uncharacterized protein n=1 Tax=Desulfarculus baarsii (strain ATCC 33931 / DSM 2075 / LMG 7858 / VKM B-1802 / 2st14) TaxID=644282 RepID=E1QE14_DESB2|nr:hypothetical protein [Desulfarculus baarsii]ADK83800.1 hypothetical protein Deba_0426 [Desulfarculus baarsii DSM 2075]
MSLDYSEIAIGDPKMVIARLTARIGQLNFSTRNIRVGLTASPEATFLQQGGDGRWSVMKLLYVTRSFAKARQMGELLRAYDAKLFVDDEQMGLMGPHASTYYAYALIR